MSNEERLRSLLSNLGKATLRGVKKCPKCGTYNGSRGSCCKNKNCDAVFKEPGEKRGKLSTEACKLITGTVAQVYSVRVRDKGPDYRGFVQLPLINNNNNDTNCATLCFIEGCEYDFDMSILQCHENNDNNNDDNDNNINNNNNNNNSDGDIVVTTDITTTADNVIATAATTITNANTTVSSCQHIQAAQKCYAEAQPLTLKNSIINKFVINNEINQEIRLLASEASIGPLVQRVSKNIMAVKCKVSSKHPLGYLHFSFYTIKLKDKIEHKYYCSCTEINNKQIDQLNHRCVHFYACICAFASDSKLCEEFSYYINLDLLSNYSNNIEKNKPIQELSSSSSSASSTIENNNRIYQIFDNDKMIEMNFDNLTTDNTHFVIFQDTNNTLTVENLNDDGARLDLESINFDPNILSSTNTLVEDINNTQSQQQQLLFQNDTDSNNHNKSIEIIPNNHLNINLINTTDYLLNDDVNDNSNKNNNNIKIVDGETIKMIDNQTIIDVKDIQFVESIIDTNKIIEQNCIQFNCNALSQINNNTNSPSVKRKRDDKKLNLNLIEIRKMKTKLNNNNNNNNNKYQMIKKKIDNNNTNLDLDEVNTNLSFLKWLASITERINQTMHYQFDGKPEPLVFHVPQIFFDCLRERISCGGKKKRLPNSTTAFIRKDGVPLGTFTKYTWQITNIIHVKSIFDTQLIPLEITKSFIENSDGTYQLYKRQETEIDRFKKNGNNPLIKPLEIKTFLKVGKTSPNQIEPTPFLIEWIPDILPISKIGELRIRFEYGHIKNITSQKQNFIK